MTRILVIDDDQAIRRSLEIQLGAEGHEVSTAGSGEEGLAAVDRAEPELVFLDVGLPDIDGLEVLRRLGDRLERLTVAMISGQQDMMATIEAIRLGAFDYIRKPLDRDDILLAIEKARLRRQTLRPDSELVEVGELASRPREIVGTDRQILEMIKQVGLVSTSRVTVLIQGETGTGKELVARAIHDAWKPDTPFVAINSSALVETLIESELFGHEKGAFTGAERTKPGKLELAGEGSVFFDEIGDMPLDLQARLLRALEERTFERVGGTESIPLRARIIAATHHDLEQLVAAGRFRQDLYFRLAVTCIQVPPLRDRRGDIPQLVRHLLGRAAEQLGRTVDSVTPEVLSALTAHDWPGNVRELENVLTRAVALSQEPVISRLPEQIGGGSAPRPVLRALWEVERDHVTAVLEACDWNVTRSAKVLEISPTTLRKKIGDYGLKRPE